MAYPLPMYYQEEDTVTRDLEYLQQMYPAEAKRYQRIIADILNTLDYEGSCIYDEYPDKWQLYKLTQAIMDRIKRMEDEKPINNMRNTNNETETPYVQEKPWEQIEELVQILLYYEIYKKRHANNRGILKF